MHQAKQPAHGPAAKKRTAGEAGWRLSRYNLTAPVPGKKGSDIIVNLFRGTVAEYNPVELYMLSRNPAGHVGNRSSIYHHDSKDTVDGPIDEILKDADVLHHTLADPTKEVKEHGKARYEKLCAELGMK